MHGTPFKIRSFSQKVKRASADKQRAIFLRIQQIHGTDYQPY